jgi:spermidine synthase
MSGNGTSEGVPRRYLCGVFLLSAGILLLELALTRVLSVALWYHFSFLIVSIALLGFGAAGVTLALWPHRIQEWRLDKALGCLALSFGLTSIGCFWLMQRIPFDPFSLLAAPVQFVLMPAYYLAAATPFYFGGLAVSLLLSRSSNDINRVYAFDLMGAGAGCVSIAIVMPLFGGSGSVVAAAAIGLLAAACFSWKEARAAARAALLLFLATIALAPAANRVIPISITANKSSRRGLAPLYSAWNTISNVNVYERNQQGWDRAFVIDGGTAATGMTDLRPGVRQYLAAHRADSDYESGIAYPGKSQPNLLIIGSGAGQQVLDGLHFGARSITAVEINSIINDVVTSRMRDFWGGLFQQPEVRLVTDEGRSFLRRSRDRYDAIVAHHTISNAAIASGALSLAENYLLTLEAFEDYLDHLTPDGIIHFTRPETQIARLFTTAREVFDRRGWPGIATHLIAYRKIPPSTGPLANRPAFGAGFLLKKSPWTPAEVVAVERLLNPPSAKPASEILYSPFAPHHQGLYYTIATTKDLPGLYAEQKAELRPATDDRPFFNQHARWSGLDWETFRDVFRQQRMGRFALEDLPIAEVTLLTLLVQSALIAAILILLPLARHRRADVDQRVPWRTLLFFSGLGLGFILIEIALLQRFTLFLGEPVYTLAAVLASLLVFSGVGSAFAGRLKSEPGPALTRIIPLLIALVAVTAVLAPYVFSAALGLPLPIRILISILLIGPLSIMLGMPFPLGLRSAVRDGAWVVPWAWGVNAFFTVIGSVLALILGMAFGFTLVLCVAGGCYLISLLAAIRNPVPQQVKVVAVAM